MSFKSELREDKYNLNLQLEQLQLENEKLKHDKEIYLKAASIYLENIMCCYKKSITAEEMLENVKNITSDNFWNACARRVRLNLSLDDCVELYTDYMKELDSISDDTMYVDEDDRSAIKLINKE